MSDTREFTEEMDDAVSEAMGEAQNLLRTVTQGMCSDWEAETSLKDIIRALCKITGDNPEAMFR